MEPAPFFFYKPALGGPRASQGASWTPPGGLPELSLNALVFSMSFCFPLFCPRDRFHPAKAIARDLPMPLLL